MTRMKTYRLPSGVLYHTDNGREQEKLDNMEFDHDGSAAAREVYRKQGRIDAYKLMKQVVANFISTDSSCPPELLKAEKYVVEGIIQKFNDILEWEELGENSGRNGEGNPADSCGSVRSEAGTSG